MPNFLDIRERLDAGYESDTPPARASSHGHILAEPVADTWLCRKCRGPRKAALNARPVFTARAVRIALACGHTTGHYADACAQVVAA